MANYAQRRDALIRTAAEAGEMVGRQKIADLMAIALNDPSVMGKDVLGRRESRGFTRDCMSWRQNSPRLGEKATNRTTLKRGWIVN